MKLKKQEEINGIRYYESSYTSWQEDKDTDQLIPKNTL